MTSDLMPLPESSNSTKSDSHSTDVGTSQELASPKEANFAGENSPDSSTETSNATSEPTDDRTSGNRQRPIPPPSEPMQYRAIGLVRGRYVASEEQFTQGSLLTSDGVELSSVLLGRIMSLVKNHLDLEKEHLWVVYPRTRQENDRLHLQIVGVWEPERLAKSSPTESPSDSEVGENPENPENSENSENPEDFVPSTEIIDGGFSVRGEVVYQAQEGGLVIKIKQAPRKQDDKPKYFKLKLEGNVDAKAVGKFWDFHAKRDGDVLTIETGEPIADLPKKRRPPFNRGGGGGRRPFNNRGGGNGAPRKPFRRPVGGEVPRPVKKGAVASGDSSPTPRPIPSRPTPKPIKKPKSEDSGD